MRDLIRNRPGAVIFATALFVRLFYLAVYDQPPVQFDARQYAAAAAVAPLAVTHPSLWNDTTAREKISFSRVVNEQIDDESIIWFPYDPPSYGQALDWLFFSGPSYPAFLSTIFHLAPFHDFWVVRITQAILDSLTALLIWLVMRRLISDRGGLVAAFLWVLYGPAIIKTGELLTESFAIFLTVAMVWSMLRAFDSQRGSWLAAAGAICSILAMAKASTALLIVPMVVAWLWTNRKGALRPRQSIALLAGAWLIVMLPWLFLVDHRYGRFAVRDPSYGDANFRQANILETEGYNTDMAPTDFWTYPVWREIRNRPVEYVRLYLQKFRRLWWRACDDYRIGFPFSETGVQWLHRLTALFAAVGVCLWTRRAGPSAWLAIAVVAYFAGLHTLMHVVSRYNLLAMPFVIGAAVCGAFWLAEEESRGFLKRLSAIVAIIAATAFLVSAARPSLWLLIPGIGTQTAVLMYWITSSTLILTAVYLSLSLRSAKGITRLVLTPSIGGLIVLVFLGWATTREAYAEWTAYIDKPGVEVRREIRLPPDIASQKIVLANVLIDGIVSHDSDFKIVLNIDHIRSAFPDSFLVVDKSFYGKPQYRSFMRMNGDHTSNVRCWSRNIIEGALLDSILQDGVVNVSLSIEGDPKPQGHLAIFGDLPQDSAHLFVGPSVRASSIERYYEGTDPRLWEKLTLESDGSGSIRYENGRADSTDLSGCFGRQSGQYRIFLRLLLADERSLSY